MAFYDIPSLKGKNMDGGEKILNLAEFESSFIP